MTTLRAAADEGEAVGFWTAEQFCNAMNADVQAIERKRRKSGA